MTAGPPLSIRAGRRDLLLSGAAYTALTGVLMTLPLVRSLHAESSAIVAGAAFFVAGLAGVGVFRRGEPVRRVLRAHLALLLVPLLGLTATMLWAPNRGWSQGLLLFGAFAPPSVALGVGLARALVVRLGRGRGAFVLVAAGVLMLTPLWDLGLHPQFYHYNHVFGGVLGPIYDEALALRPGLFAFRGLTLAWAALLVAWSYRDRARTLALGVLVALTYALGPWLGLNTPAWRTADVLGSHARSAHFELYYSAAHLTPAGARRRLVEAEYAYARLAHLWRARPDERVRIYLYPDPETRRALTGAAYTNVAPVWLPDPQVHVLGSAWDRVLDHELAHVFSRPFGLPVVRASALVGLVEGLAGAAEPPDGDPSATEQVAATLGAEGEAARRLAGAMGAGGFWGGRGAVSYATTASFVAFLAERYGWPAVLDAYAWGDLERVTGEPVERLAAEWERHVRSVAPIPVEAAPLATRRFGRPSLFEKPSPHWVPLEVRLVRAADHALLGLRPDTTAALRLLGRALEQRPAYASALARWADLKLHRGRADSVVRRVRTLYGRADTSRAPSGLLRLHADALALTGEHVRALRAYDTLLARHRLLDAPRAVWTLRVGRQAVAEGSAQARYGGGWGGAGGVLRALDHPSAPQAYDVLARADAGWASPGERRLGEGIVALGASEAAWRAARWGDAQRAAARAAAAFGAAGYLPGERLARHRAERAAWAERHARSALEAPAVDGIVAPPAPLAPYP